MNRYTYSDDFKRQAVVLFRQVGISKACKEVHVTRATLYRWNREYDECIQASDEIKHAAKDSETAGDQYQPVEEELRQLREQVNAQKGLNRKLKKALILLLSDGE